MHAIKRQDIRSLRADCEATVVPDSHVQSDHTSTTPDELLLQVILSKSELRCIITDPQDCIRDPDLHDFMIATISCCTITPLVSFLCPWDQVTSNLPVSLPFSSRLFSAS